MKEVNIKIDEDYLKLLEKMVETFETKGFKTSKKDVVQKALYNFASEVVLESEIVYEMIDKPHYERNLKKYNNRKMV